MTFDPNSVEVTDVTLPKDCCIQVPWKYVKACGYSNPFVKYLNQRSLTSKWPLTPRLLRSHVWRKDHCFQVPWEYINLCGYSDQFFKYNILHTYIHIHTYYIHNNVQNEWSHRLVLNTVQARQKAPDTHQKCQIMQVWKKSKSFQHFSPLSLYYHIELNFHNLFSNFLILHTGWKISNDNCTYRDSNWFSWMS